MAKERKSKPRKWMLPNKRANGYAEERKAQVHMFGKKEGQPLDEYNKGVRSGYLLAQSDATELYWYKKGKQAEEATKADRKGKSA